jgi:hypothetical protein
MTTYFVGTQLNVDVEYSDLTKVVIRGEFRSRKKGFSFGIFNGYNLLKCPCKFIGNLSVDRLRIVGWLRS